MVKIDLYKVDSQQTNPVGKISVPLDDYKMCEQMLWNSKNGLVSGCLLNTNPTNIKPLFFEGRSRIMLEPGEYTVEAIYKNENGDSSDDVEFDTDYHFWYY